MNEILHNLMIADDDLDDCDFFKDAINELYNATCLTVVNDGEQLMKYLLKPVEALPHLLFLDINMPRKNGEECLKEIRANDNLKDIPVVVYSTCSNTSTIKKLFDLGANYYVCKPSNFENLKKIIAKVVSLVDQRNPFANNIDSFLVSV